MVLHYGSFHWIIAWLPPQVCSCGARLKHSSACGAVAPPAFVHLRSASGWVVAFASKMGRSFGRESWKCWKRTWIALESWWICVVHFYVFHAFRVVKGAVFVNVDELFVVMVTRTEELAIFSISFDFCYLSDLIDCMKVWVFQVFKFQVVESGLFLDRLHLIESYIFVFRELGVELVIIWIELILHFPQLLASIENTTPAWS